MSTFKIAAVAGYLYSPNCREDLTLGNQAYGIQNSWKPRASGDADPRKLGA